MKALMLLLFAGSVAAQTPAPSSQPESKDATTAPKPRPPLNLSLDPRDIGGSRITFEPREDKKAPVEATLPGMGGERTRTWEQPSDKIFPPDTNPNSR